MPDALGLVLGVFGEMKIDIHVTCTPKTMPGELREYPITGIGFRVERVLS
jgi:hypothetical protein